MTAVHTSIYNMYYCLCRAVYHQYTSTCNANNFVWSNFQHRHFRMILALVAIFYTSTCIIACASRIVPYLVQLNTGAQLRYHVHAYGYASLLILLLSCLPLCQSVKLLGHATHAPLLPIPTRTWNTTNKTLWYIYMYSYALTELHHSQYITVRVLSTASKVPQCTQPLDDWFEFWTRSLLLPLKTTIGPWVSHHIYVAHNYYGRPVKRTKYC